MLPVAYLLYQIPAMNKQIKKQLGIFFVVGNIHPIQDGFVCHGCTVGVGSAVVMAVCNILASSTTSGVATICL